MLTRRGISGAIRLSHRQFRHQNFGVSPVCLVEQKYGRKEIKSLLNDVSEGKMSPNDAMGRLRMVFDEHIEVTLVF